MTEGPTVRTRLVRLAGLLATVTVSGALAEEPLAVNHVVVTESLHTAGQPSAKTLAELGARGFDLVVNLAPPSSRDAVAEEGQLVAANGAAYVNIPVDWQRPTYQDFALFSAVMSGAAARKVLVHCQMNMRASVFTFLYRVVHEHVPPAQAFEAVAAVWTPRDQWADFARTVLDRHGVDFELPTAAPAP
jgi:protein tyrosine phosphatase (PTP) superfamily phosphohydrolase (DUF442 family)